MAGKCTRTCARTLGAEVHKSSIRVTRWHNTYKILNCIERHNFCLSDLLTNSNRTTLQSHKVEERTFGTPVVLMQSEYQRSLYTLFALKFVLIKPYCFLHYKSCASNLFHGIRMPNTYPEASVAQGPKRITQ